MLPARPEAAPQTAGSGDQLTARNAGNFNLDDLSDGVRRREGDFGEGLRPAHVRRLSQDAVTAADLTARCGTLGPALAMHLVNNIGSLLLIGTLGDMQGLALYVVPTGLSDPNLMPFLVLDAMLILIAWLGARIVLRR